MRVLQITHHALPCIGGIEKFAIDLCLGLKNKRIESEILCLNKCPGSKKILQKEEEMQGIKIRRIPFLDLKYYKLAALPLFGLKKFDIIHVHNIGFFSDFLALTKPIHRKKLVLSTHGGFFHTKNMSFLKKIYFSTFCRFSLGLFDIVIADSKNDEGVFSKILPEKTVLVPNGVEGSSGKPRGKGQIWRKMFHYFSFNQEEFLQHYHTRSNIESTFNMVKAKFSDLIRNRKETAQTNELLLKVLCHNIVVNIQEMHELGINSDFKDFSPKN